MVSSRLGGCLQDVGYKAALQQVVEETQKRVEVNHGWDIPVKVEIHLILPATRLAWPRMDGIHHLKMPRNQCRKYCIIIDKTDL